MTGQLPARVLRGSGSGWGPALRVARRELLRAKVRSLLVLLMVLLPVTGVVGLSTLLRTSDLTVAERLPRDLGSAQARIEPRPDGPVQQTPDLRGQQGSSVVGRTATPDRLAAVLAPGTRLLTVTADGIERVVLTPDRRRARVAALGVDLRDPGRRGPFALLDGAVPVGRSEVAVSPALARFGFPVGAALLLPDGRSFTVTGVVGQTDGYSEELAVLGLPATLGLERTPVVRAYAYGPTVGWDQVRQLNELGAFVLSRAVVLDPPPADQVPDLLQDSELASTAALVALVVVIAVLEVVLLAGPAFAVGARRQRRALALLAAGGGEPRHVRRVVLAQGLLVGALVVVLAPLLGLSAAAAVSAVVAQVSPDSGWGPFDVSLRDIVLVCLLGAGTALLAALVPAVVASRLPVVASLQGRRVPPVRTGLPTVTGVVLLVLGVLACALSVRQYPAELWVAASAVPTVLGAALLAPGLLALLGRTAGRLPLPVRYAVRDADRQRGRTAPAVAAITATVAGVVAFGVALSSDGVEQEAQHVRTGPPGVAVVTASRPDADLAGLAGEVRAVLPRAAVREVRGIDLASPADPTAPYPAVLLCRSDEPAAPSCNGFATVYNGAFGTTLLVGPAAFEALVPLLDPRSVPAARQALADGRVLVGGAPDGARVVLRRVLLSNEPGALTPTVRPVSEVVAPVFPLRARDGGSVAPVQAVLPEAVAARLGGAVPTALLAGESVTEAQEERLDAAVRRQDTAAFVSVERGPQPGTPVALLLLGGAAAFLVLGGTLAASSLALAEARPDLATLGSLGAPPGARRTVAAAYTGVLALVGAVLGCVAGLVPGVAGGVAITRSGYRSPGTEELGLLAYVDVPWLLLLGLVVLLPLLAGAVAGLTTRSRLPALGRRVQA